MVKESMCLDEKLRKRTKLSTVIEQELTLHRDE